MIDDDHSSRTEQPCTSCRHDANGTGSEYNDGITSLDSSHLRCLVTCGNHIGQQDCIFNVHAFRDDCGSNVRIRYAHIFGLTTIITARRMRVTEESTYSSSLRVRLMTIAVQLLLAKRPTSTRDIERNHNVISMFQILHARSDFFDNPCKLMTESHSYARIRNQSVI